MWCIIEMQGYSTQEYLFLPKEVFLTSKDGNKKFLVRLPKDFNEFSKTDRNRIIWTTSKYHHIPWPIGNCELDSLQTTLKAETSKYNFILTKGAEKATYLSSLLNRTVIDLTFYGCPSIRKENAETPCGIHLTQKNTHCAVASARFIKNWLDGNRHIREIFETA